MTVIVVESDNKPKRRFEIDAEDDQLIAGLEKFISDFNAAKVTKREAFELSPALMKARAYLDSIENDPESVKSLEIASELRAKWIRNHD